MIIRISHTKIDSPIEWVRQIVPSLVKRIRDIVTNWLSFLRHIPHQLRTFIASFDHPSSKETRANSKKHDLTRYMPWRPLHHAAWKGSDFYINTLLKIHDVNEKDVEKVTPLHCAAIGGQITTVLKLIAAGADVNAQDMRGQPPLYWAAYRGHSAIVQLLIAQGADVNAADLRGKTPLRAAAKYGLNATVITLSLHGANVNALDKKKQTPHFIACLHGRMKTAHLLECMGACTSQTNIDGKSTHEIMGRTNIDTYLRYKFSKKFDKFSQEKIAIFSNNL